MINHTATASPRRRPASTAGAGRVQLNPDIALPPSEKVAGIHGFTDDIVDQWGRQSFPASDPPPNW